MAYPRCPECHTQDSHTTYDNEGRTWQKCNQCGALWTHLLPKEKAMLAGEWDFYARLSDFIIRGNRKSDDSFNIEIYSYDDENTQTRELSGGRQLSLTEEELRLTIGLLRTML